MLTSLSILDYTYLEPWYNTMQALAAIKEAKTQLEQASRGLKSSLRTNGDYSTSLMWVFLSRISFSTRVTSPSSANNTAAE